MFDIFFVTCCVICFRFWPFLTSYLLPPFFACCMKSSFPPRSLWAETICSVFRSAPSCLLLGQLNYLGASHQVWHVLVVVMFYWWHQTAVHIMHFRHSQACPKQTSSSWVRLIGGQSAAGSSLFADISLTLYINTQRSSTSWVEVAVSLPAALDYIY